MGCGRALFIFADALFTIVGVGLLMLVDSEELLPNVMKFLFPAFGIIALIVGIRLPHIQRQTTPDEIIFDNANGRVQVNQNISEVKSAWIYYDEIEDFIIKPKKQQSSSSRSSRSSYSFHIYLAKKDGGQWELLSKSSEESARQEIQKLKSIIDLQKAPVREANGAHSSSKYKISDYGSRTEVTWRNPLGYGPLFMFMFCAVFLTIFYTIFSSINFDDFGWFAYGVLGFIGVVFVIVIGGNILKMIKNAKTVYAVSISDMSLNYQEKDLGGRTMKEVPFLMKDLHALSFSFDTDVTMRKIFIYTHEQFQKRNIEPKFSLESIRELIAFQNELVALDLQELTAVEALHLENYLQEQIRLKSRTDVR